MYLEVRLFVDVFIVWAEHIKRRRKGDRQTCVGYCRLANNVKIDI